MCDEYIRQDCEWHQSRLIATIYSYRAVSELLRGQIFILPTSLIDRRCDDSNALHIKLSLLLAPLHQYKCFPNFHLDCTQNATCDGRRAIRQKQRVWAAFAQLDCCCDEPMFLCNRHSVSSHSYRIWRHQLLPVCIYRGSTKRPKMPHPMVLFALSIMQCHRNLQTSRVRMRRNVSYSATLWWASCSMRPYTGRRSFLDAVDKNFASFHAECSSCFLQSFS